MAQSHSSSSCSSAPGLTYRERQVQLPVDDVVETKVESDKQLSDKDTIVGSTLSFKSDDERTKRPNEVQATEAPKRAVYEKPDLEKIVEESCQHLEPQQRTDLLAVLQKHEPLFEEKRSNWTGDKTSIQPYSIPLENKEVMHKIVGRKKDGKLPLVSALRDYSPWEKVQLDCIGPLTIKHKHPVSGKEIVMETHLLIMLDACTNWPEFARLSNATAKQTAILFDKKWMSHYPRPIKVGYDNGTEFTCSDFQ
jgi:hypothetical protein